MMRKLKEAEVWGTILFCAVLCGLAVGVNWRNATILTGGNLAACWHHPVDPPSARWVKSILPDGTSSWHKLAVDIDGGTNMQDLLERLRRESFGPDILYAQREANPTSAQPGIEVRRAGGRREYGRPVDEYVASRAPNMVRVVARHPDGTIFYDHIWHNLRVNAGINWQYGQMAGGTAAVCTYIALSNTAVTPAATDTTLSGEITATYGLQRAVGTPTHSSNATSYTVIELFSNSSTATQQAQATGLFNASSGGTMCFENTFTQVTLNQNDTLTVTWTITF